MSRLDDEQRLNGEELPDADALIRRFRSVVPAEGTHGPQPVWRTGSVLRNCLHLSRVERARIWRHGGVTVNGVPVEAQHTHCYPGDVVAAWYPEPQSSVQPEPALPLVVLYEDTWLLAVAKPAGRLSHPARSEQHGTVANAVAARYPIAGSDLPEPVRLIHRLDRDTSGVLVFARDAGTARTMARLRSSGRLVREYLALVHGHPPVTGEIDLPIGPDPTHRVRQRVYPFPVAVPVVASEAAIAYASRTTYHVIQYGKEATLLAARLHTGRMHQLRVHLAAIGHPLLGDDLYGAPSAAPSGTPSAAPPAAVINRQALHAWQTRLEHPVSGAWLTIMAPIPEDFRAAARAVLLGL